MDINKFKKPYDSKAMTKLRNRAINREFNRLSSKMHNGVSIYSYEFMIKKLSEKFYLAEATIEAILKRTK
jgi:hypothetical protein